MPPKLRKATDNRLLPWLRGRTEDGAEAVLTVCNNGKGFSKEMLHNAFEPYVTDKPTGTGLGLPVVKKIIEEHGAASA